MRSSNHPFRARRLLAIFPPESAAIALEHFAKIRRDLQRVGRTFPMLFRQDKRRLCLIAAGFLLLAVPRPTAGPETALQSTLQEAKHLAWLNNWTEAAVAFDRLESSGLMPGDEATAQIGRASCRETV